MEIGIDHLLKIVEGQARLETKIDGFMATQQLHDTKLSGLDARVDRVEADIVEIKSQRKTDAKVVAVVTSIAVSCGGMAMWILNAVGFAAIRDFLAKL